MQPFADFPLIVYTVVTVGVTVLGLGPGLATEVGVHVHEFTTMLAPQAVSVVLWPAQSEADEVVRFAAGSESTVIEIVFEYVQPAVVIPFMV